MFFMTKEELWGQILKTMEIEVSKTNFITWFQNTYLNEIFEDKISIAVPNAFVKEWLEQKYHKTLLKTARNFLPEAKTVEYIISPQSATALQPAKMPIGRNPTTTISKEQLKIRDIFIDPQTNLSPKYNFENFIVGSFNELAYAAAQAVIKNPGALYNPYFVYGGVGLGKTHLLQAIGNEIKKNRPGVKIQYLAAEKFSKELIESIQKNTINAFKDKYRAYDALVLDDIQFISGKARTQEEIFHTFNSLYEEGKQIVFSSDCPPKAIQNLEERLRSRFEGGIIVDISEPEYETRFAILKTKLQNKEVVLKQEILEYLAENIKSNIRELEGALNLILSKSSFLKKELDIDEVKKLLSQNVKTRKILTPNQVIKNIASFYDMTEKQILEKTRRKEIVYARQIAMYILREDFNNSLPFIGQKFGDKDHTTVLHACNKITEQLKQNEKTKEEIKYIREQLYKDIV